MVWFEGGAYARRRASEPEGVINVLFGFWGGEGSPKLQFAHTNSAICTPNRRENNKFDVFRPPSHWAMPPTRPSPHPSTGPHPPSTCRKREGDLHQRFVGAERQQLHEDEARE